MEIGVTEGLRKFTKMKPLPAATENDPFFCWDVNRLDIGGRKLLLMANSANRLCVITRMQGAEWKRLLELAPTLIMDAMMSVGFGMAEYEAYMKAAGEIALTKTHGRKSLGGLTDIYNTIWYDDIDMGDKPQLRLMDQYNNKLICYCATREDYGYAHEWFAEDLLSHGIPVVNKLFIPKG